MNTVTLGSYPFLIRTAECPLAQDFIRRDFKAVLRKHGFTRFSEDSYYGRHIRLLTAWK